MKVGTLNDDELATIASLKSLNGSLHESMAAMQLSNNIVMQVLIAVLDRRVGPEVCVDLAKGLRDTWDASYRALGYDHPIAKMT